MRLSTSMMYQNGLNSLLDQQATLARLQEQLGTGRAFLSPADDPLAAALTVNITQTASMNETYKSNRATANRTLGLEDNALKSIGTTVQEILTRIVQAGNGTMSDADRQTLTAALTSARDQLVGLGNTTDGNGQYLFSGYQGGTEPFVMDGAGNVSYQGDQGQRMIQVDQTRQLASSDTGTDIFGKAAAGTLAYITRADLGNAGTGKFSVASYDVPSATNFVKSDFSIEFNAAAGGGMEYTVTVTHPTVPPTTTVMPTQPYTSGDTIDMNGVSLRISGEPADGDTFTVETPKASNMDMFEGLNKLIDVLGQPIANDPVANARLINELASANKQITLGYDNILTVQASVGARMNELDALEATGTEKGLSYGKQLSDLEDVDPYKVTSELVMRQTALSAAAQAYTLIRGSSLFSMNR
ncbi:flagellar hook-associated protein FlgL [Bordetella genomosp. 13]|uniref:Flagellar hook-associated protein 3 n=1 Tax=Bordetella genomosp. 13 TaxID=463040 RepID=A0A1W6ZAG7_9BORD|nr:flagellar hook-associated protein FlgL [Bordetella genomosp. 13]ARP94309.1 flagellar hook-associated protein 3 [Bordetella genomosp. 13]